MKTLTLIRHGKASQDFGFKDFDRPLLPNGVENSKKIAANFSDNFQKDAIIWASSAKRASETAITFVNCLKIDTNQIIFKDELYTFDASNLHEIIKSCPNGVKNLIIFGHNGAITDFVNKFGDIYIDNVPTSGLVTMQFETNDWKLISNGKTIQTLFPSQF
jgi:phosphohistidine phosphatase